MPTPQRWRLRRAPMRASPRCSTGARRVAWSRFPAAWSTSWSDLPVAGVAIVTDSTAYLPASVAGDVHVVPLRVHLGARTFVDGVDVTPADVVRTLKAKQPVSTS